MLNVKFDLIDIKGTFNLHYYPSLTEQHVNFPKVIGLQHEALNGRLNPVIRVTCQKTQYIRQVFVIYQIIIIFHK